MVMRDDTAHSFPMWAMEIHVRSPATGLHVSPQNCLLTAPDPHIQLHPLWSLLNCLPSREVILWLLGHPDLSTLDSEHHSSLSTEDQLCLLPQTQGEGSKVKRGGFDGNSDAEGTSHTDSPGPMTSCSWVTFSTILRGKIKTHSKILTKGSIKPYLALLLEKAS